MVLPGKLASTTLGDLLGQCHRSRATGALTLVESQGRTHRVHLLQGLVTAVEVDRASPSLGDILRDEVHAPDEPTLRRSLLRSLASARLHGEVLVQDFSVSPSVIVSALRRQIQIRLSALESLREASVRFHVTEAPPRHALLATPLAETEFLHGKKRARDAEAQGTWQRPPSYGQTTRIEGSERERKARRVLGVDPQASELEIKRAYRRLVRALHPDLNPEATSAERSVLGSRFAEATEAYRLLTAS
ncbi:MAG: molecular chaperone DnaJ [Proteobacteria bacterium]|nr:MAG: molecular chaperone DnaJ [Pseudomonadota bacterium]